MAARGTDMLRGRSLERTGVQSRRRLGAIGFGGLVRPAAIGGRCEVRLSPAPAAEMANANRNRPSTPFLLRAL